MRPRSFWGSLGALFENLSLTLKLLLIKIEKKNYICVVSKKPVRSTFDYGEAILQSSMHFSENWLSSQNPLHVCQNKWKFRQCRIYFNLRLIESSCISETTAVCRAMWTSLKTVPPIVTLSNFFAFGVSRISGVLYTLIVPFCPWNIKISVPQLQQAIIIKYKPNPVLICQAEHQCMCLCDCDDSCLCYSE